MMLWIGRCSLLFTLLLLILSGCLEPSVKPVEEDKPITEQTQEKYVTKSAELEPEEKTVVLGLEGYQEEVTFYKYANPWLTLWVDSQLEQHEAENIIMFEQETNDLSFTIQQLANEEAEHQYEQVFLELLDFDYELINEFPLVTRVGKGSIFYSYAHRHSIDLYYVEEKQHRFLVKFTIPDELMESYIHRFEYMFDSIDITS